MFTNYDAIYREAQRVKTEYTERFPKSDWKSNLKKLCTLNRLSLEWADTSLSTRHFKGVCVYHCRKYVAKVNRKLKGRLLVIVVLHELGHKVLHFEELKSAAVVDRNIFGFSDWMEVEANVFVADFLLDDAEVLQLIYNSGWTFSQIASYLQIPEEFLAFKCKSINYRLGKNIRIPITVHGNCLKDLESDDYDE